MPAVHSILVPVDGSPPSIAALEHAIALAEDGDARIDVLHVEGPDEFGIGSSTPLTSSERRQLDRAMDEALDLADRRLGPRMARRSITGDPLRTIIETASAGHYDLIVIGTHGRVGRLHALLGSVAEGVVRNAPCPVLTVREPGAGYESFAERRHGRPSIAGSPSGTPHAPR
jgi:nucleotide-binding universal stress UspA family protein